MGSKAEQLLVVLSVVEGRQFPRRPRHELVVQAKFDGEQLATDPVEHIEQPQFCTELAWELDRKTLQQHRLQRTPIKVQCFAVNSATSARELVGYIILDLRSVQEVKKAPKWHPLLNSKYTKLKPAILLSLVLENDSKEAPEQVKAKDAPRRQGETIEGSPLLPSMGSGKLDVVLREDEGYHQIGPPDCCTDFFVLSVTVAFATNLEQLIPCTMRLSLESPHFFFYYTLLGNDITSEPFETLISPSFEPERASVRVRSSVQVFRAYLSQQPNLQIHLCCGNSSLGSAEIPLANLVKAGVDLEKQPATVEGAFVLVPLSEAKHNQLSIPADLQPKVGVSITVRREGIDTEVGSPCLQRGGGQHTPVKKGTQSPRFPGSPVGEQKPRPVSPSCCSPIPLVHPPTESKSNNFLEHPELALPTSPAPGPSVPSATQIQTEPEPPTSSVGISLPKISIPASAHHYYFSMDLRSIQGMDVGFSAKCILRYSYQFFGNVSPITTCPPVEVKKNVEVLLPKSYCAFEFAALPHQMQETFLRMPLVVEVLHRDANAEDLLLGTASVQLSHLLTAEKTRFVGQFGQEHWKQSFSETIPVVRARGPNDKVADLNYVTTLEDLGLVRVQDVLVSESMQSGNLGMPKSDGAPGQPPSAVVAPTELRETMEYKVAMELEAWKELQEDLFDSQLKQKELRHMQELLEETRRRDREREALVKKKEVEYTLLEEQVQKTLADLEKREKQLAHAEMEMQRLQKELKAKHELSMREVQESSRRLREDCLHQVELERSKVRLLEEERSRLQQQIREADTKYKQLEKEFQLYREQQNTKPEVRLQSEINLLSLEKVELERKLESTTKSKLHYKQQWGRALKELARFKQREQEAAMMRLKKQQQELEHMRLRYLAAEEKETVKSEKQQLEDIRNELNRLKQQEDKRPPMELPQEPSLSESTDDHLSRLLEERDTLLRTGVYTHEDRIIAELNRQIQEAMSRRPAR
ncbi:centrosomal protein of 120 kDa isoform X1 [Scleropages formosus]|uniref:centrosomal protein of 120 kDa isoform X1 n=1 Tax=Scleropages formosus TaxID=113540 RepID=UPI0010FAA90F|nr:centrosomal protein of 120 kDa isoform X1 [Scleropages formosus]